MTKRTKKRQGPRKGIRVVPKSQPKATKRRNERPSLDAHALRYRALLADPCNAPLVAPPYEVAGSGYFIRVHQVLALANVDGIVQFNPTGLSSSTDSFAMWHIGSSASTGGALGTIGGNTGPNILYSTGGLVRAYRPVAGCIKLMYTGSELNRQGTIFPIISQKGPVLRSGRTSTSSLTNYLTAFGPGSRLGSRVHEVKWVPTNTIDEMFVGQSDGDDTLNAPYGGTTVGFAYQNVPSGTLSVEMTFVYEWVPVSYIGPSSSTVAISPSRNTVHDVLRSIGNVAGFVYGAVQKYGPTVAEIVGGGINSMAGLQAMMTIA